MYALVIKSMLNWTEHEIYPAHKCLNASTCWLLNVHKQEIYNMWEFKSKNNLYFQHFRLSSWKFMLSWVEQKSCITSGFGPKPLLKHFYSSTNHYLPVSNVHLSSDDGLYKGYSIFWKEYAIYFIEWSKKCIFHEWRSHEWNIHFLVSRDEINGIFIPKIWIFF